MDTPGYDPVSMTGIVAGGANVLVFTTGRGSVFGCKPAPSHQGGDQHADVRAHDRRHGHQRRRDPRRRRRSRRSAGRSSRRSWRWRAARRRRASCNGVGEEEFAPWTHRADAVTRRGRDAGQVSRSIDPSHTISATIAVRVTGDPIRSSWSGPAARRSGWRRRSAGRWPPRSRRRAGRADCGHGPAAAGGPGGGASPACSPRSGGLACGRPGSWECCPNSAWCPRDGPPSRRGRAPADASAAWAAAC